MQNYFKICFFLLVCQNVFANDSAGTTAAGGIQFIKTPTVKMVSEDLTISPTYIKVIYQFKNLSNKAITTTIFFPVPAYRVQGANQPWDDEIAVVKNAPFKNFSVLINKQPVNYQIKTRALLAGKDITALLIKAGIPLNTALAAGQVPMNEQQYAKFKQWQLKAQQLNLLDNKGYPRWQKQIIYYWTQTFTAKQLLTISHEYKPAAGEFYAVVTPAEKPSQSVAAVNQRIKLLFGFKLATLENSKNFQNWLSQQITQPATNGICAFIYNVNYILTTGANWAGPIQQFTLTLQYPADGTVAYNAFYQDNAAMVTKKMNKIQLQLSQFTPKQDLKIIFASRQAQ